MKIWITDMTTRFQATYLIIFATAPHQCVVKKTVHVFWVLRQTKVHRSTGHKKGNARFSIKR